VHVSAIEGHLTRLQEISEEAGSNSNREAMGLGYNRSVAYVMGVLVGAGYDPKPQNFRYLDFSVQADPVFSVNGLAVPSTVYGNVRYGGSGVVTGKTLQDGKNGCNALDYGGKKGDVYVVFDDDTCTTLQRVTVASEAGAGAVVIVMTDPDRSVNTLEDVAPLPVLRINQFFGTLLKSGSIGATVSLETKNAATWVDSSNVICETAGGDPNHVVLVGAHLDSVSAGPGINDNGSGSCTILTVAVELARLRLTPVNKIRFVFFGAEEAGLLGSKHYVKELTKQGDDVYKLAMMLNLDMVGSPNYFYGIYNGTNHSLPAGVIQGVFEDYATSQNIPHEPTPFTGRSDYGPFLDYCPAGGLFTGAEATKDLTGRNTYGGMDLVPFDPCYHQACDTLENINWESVAKMSQLTAYAVQHFGFMANLRSYLGTN
jgi:hypothetical protein